MPTFKFRSSAPKPLPPAEEIDSELFWLLVNMKTQEECWEWQDVRNKGGYGLFTVNYRPLQATRVSYLLSYGQDPLNMVVRHKCDNPPCVNPWHLELGSQKENMQDAVLRGRIANGSRNGSVTKPESRPRGVRNGISKLNDAAVVHIRERYAAGDTCEALAREFEVMGSLVARIVHGKIWTHAGGPIFPGRLKNTGERSGGKLRREDAIRAIELRVEGRPVEEICEILGVTQGAIWPIIYGTSWRDLDRSALRKVAPKKHLSRDLWPEIIAARERGETLKAIAARYGVGLTAIHYIVKASKGEG